MNFQVEKIKQNVEIPNTMIERLSKLSIEEQVSLFTLERCRTVTHWIDQKVENLENYHGEEVDYIREKYPLLVKDGYIVEIYLPHREERLLWFSHPYSKIISWNGHRTDSEGWGYEEEHEWYVFKYQELESGKEEQLNRFLYGKDYKNTVSN